MRRRNKKVPNWVCVEHRFATQSSRDFCPECGRYKKDKLVYLYDYKILPKASATDWKRIKLLIDTRLEREAKKRLGAILSGTFSRSQKLANIVFTKQWKRNKREAAKLASQRARGGTADASDLGSDG